MSIETITIILSDEPSVPAHLAAATGLARAYDAHLQVLALGVGLDLPGIVQTAMDAVPLPTQVEESHEKAAQIAAAAEAVLGKEDVRWDIDQLATLTSQLRLDLIQHTRFTDLVVQHRLAGVPAETIRDLTEMVLFDADAPLLILPEEGGIAAPAGQIMVGWDESATALRAARLAMPFLVKAGKVHVALVDPSRDSPDRSDPGGAFAQFLARHGVRAEVTVLNRTDASIPETLERRAGELGCDMLVMGAYGHSRLRQALFGGTTRNMLERGRMPVFLAH